MRLAVAVHDRLQLEREWEARRQAEEAERRRAVGLVGLRPAGVTSPPRVRRCVPAKGALTRRPATPCARGQGSGDPPGTW